MEDNGHDPEVRKVNYVSSDPLDTTVSTTWLPIVNSSNPLYQDIDQALANNLDKEGLCRLRAVEETVKFFSTRQLANSKEEQKNFQQFLEETYQFLIKQNNGNK